jgi:P27 family predicted phage terminase small subunit
MTMIRNLRNDIIAHLQKKGNYEPEVDDYQIDILIENIEYATLMKENLKENGIIVDIPNGNGIITTKENPAYGTYVKCVTHINQSSTKLGISRNDRIKLKLLEEKKEDEFDNDFK